MNKLDLIILIDIMCGLTESEYKQLQEKSIDEIEIIYINAYQEQDDEQNELCYF